MKKLLEDAESFYRPKMRPSGHDINKRFANDNGGAIPSNLLQIPNTESNSPYQRHCATVGVKPHPARFPEKLPMFFIEFLTDPGDLPAPTGARQAGTVLDIFAGSNTTGSAAEKLNRRWIAFAENCRYLCRVRIPLRGRTVRWRSRHALGPRAFGRFAGVGESAAARAGAQAEQGSRSGGIEARMNARSREKQILWVPPHLFHASCGNRSQIRSGTGMPRPELPAIGYRLEMNRAVRHCATG